MYVIYLQFYDGDDGYYSRDVWEGSRIRIYRNAVAEYGHKYPTYAAAERKAQWLLYYSSSIDAYEIIWV